jgi:hypothetical protein
MVAMLRRLRREEQGMSLMELVVVTALLSLVGIMVAQSMISSARVSAAGQDRSTTIDETRTALERIERDIRAANPIEELATTADYDSTLMFSIYCSNAGVGSCGADNLREVTWQVVGNSLQRLEGTSVGFELAPNGPSGLPDAQKRLAVVNPADRPVFSYYDATGALMPTTGATALPPADFRHCAKQVVITLFTNAESGTAPEVIELSTSATIRNYNEVSGC